MAFALSSCVASVCPNQPPVAVAAATPTSGPASLTVNFDGSGSYDPDGDDPSTLAYSWDFGDGATASGVTATHTYADDGIYTALLRVTDSSGASGTDTVVITVGNPPPVGMIATEPDPPTVSVGEAVTFHATGSYDPAAGIDAESIILYEWDFDDHDGLGWEAGAGPDALGETVVHSYESAGTYTVTLRVLDDDGATATATVTVTVTGGSPPSGLSFTRTDIPISGIPTGVTTGPFDSPGPDIAVSNYDATSQVTLLLDPAPPIGSSIVDLDLDTLKPQAIATGNFDGMSGDLVTANANGTIAVLLRDNVTGDYPAYVTYDVFPSPLSVVLEDVAVGDFNGDGYDDIVTANGNEPGEQVSVLLNNGDGTFGTLAVYALHSDSYVYSVTTGDFDGDGNLDIAATNYYGAPPIIGSISILFGDGAGGFSSPVEVTVSSPFKTTSIAAGHFYHDSSSPVEDIAVGGYSGGGSLVAVVEGSVMRSFSSPTEFFPVLSWPVSMAVGDFNHDGKDDLVTANKSSNNVSVLLLDGTGHFAPAQNFDVGDGPASVTVEDLDSDGFRDDIVTANGGSRDVTILIDDL